jgi:hypothetical protein
MMMECGSEKKVRIARLLPGCMNWDKAWRGSGARATLEEEWPLV